MTEKEFLALAPRKQDAVVDEKVMGLEWLRGDDHLVFAQEPRHYTTDISAAWGVVEKMGGYGRALFEWSEGWIFELVTSDGESMFGQAPTAPIAICIAALKAVGEIE